MVQREVAAQTDYKIDYGLGHMCMNEIQKNQCMPPQDSDQGMQISYVILCLEGVIHKSGTLLLNTVTIIFLLSVHSYLNTASYHFWLF